MLGPYLRKRKMKNLRRHWGIILILIAFLALGCGHAIWAPLFVKPDEERHFAYVVHIRKTGSLPLVGGRTAMPEVFDRILIHKKHQAPLYYLLASAFILPIPSNYLDDVERLYLPNPHFLSTIGGNRNRFVPCPCKAAKAVYAVRFLSLAFGAVVVIATYLIGLRFLPQEVALMGSAGVAFLPSFAFIATSVDNDIAAAAFVTLSLLVAVEILKNGFTVRRGLVFGLIAGMAGLSKLFGLTAFALVPFLALMSPGQRKEKLKGAMAALSGSLISLPWFVGDWVLFGGPLAILAPKQQRSVMELREMLAFVWKSFWLDFSHGRILYGPPWVYWFYGLLTVVGALGLIKALRHRVAKAFFGLCLLQLAFILVPQLLLSVGYFVGGGRYLLTVVSGIMLLLAYGVRELLPYRCTPIIWHLVLGSLALYALVGVLIPGYHLPSGQVASLPAEPMGFLEDKFALVKYEYDKTTLAPGEELKVEIYWQLLRPVSENYSVFVQLLGREGEREWPVAQVDTYPGLGYYPTCRWRVGEVVKDCYILRLPDDLPPLEGDLRLIAGMYKFETMKRLEAYQLRDGRRELYQDAFTLGFINVAAPGD